MGSGWDSAGKSGAFSHHAHKSVVSGSWPSARLINAYRGDVIKFSGDALMIYFPAVDDTLVGDQSKFKVPPHGSYHQPAARC